MPKQPKLPRPMTTHTNPSGRSAARVAKWRKQMQIETESDPLAARYRAYTAKLGATIKRKRTEAGLSLTELADELESTYAQVQSWETGRRFPTRDRLAQLVLYFNLDGGELIENPHRIEDEEPLQGLEDPTEDEDPIVREPQEETPW